LHTGFLFHFSYSLLPVTQEVVDIHGEDEEILEETGWAANWRVNTVP
jgi:hypothetical protein